MRDDSVKIIDFGIAAVSQTRNRECSDKGTLLYLAPESEFLQPVAALGPIRA